MNKLDLLENLLQNNSIEVQLNAKDWKEAIKLCIEPLIKAKTINEKYYESIIESVKTHGPYFIISDFVAMPHAQDNDSVNENSFSLITLKNEIYFENDNRPISILIGLASNSPDIHVALALPQIVAIFEEKSNIEKIKNAKTKDEIIEIIKKVDLKKYLI